MSLMNLKRIFKSKDLDESQFIIGIDLGSATSSICYFDLLRNQPEIIDISGGYGKTTMPTVIQYIPSSKEWVYGEYAVLNRGVSDDITFSYLIDKLGKKEYVEIDNKLESVVSILSLYLKELINSCKNINPKSEIAGIVVAIPSYLPIEAKDELLRCFSLIGYDKKILEFVSDRECILSNHYFNKKVDKENIVILDYGSRELRGGVFSVTPKGKDVNVNTLSYLYDEELGTKNFDDEINNIFMKLYEDNTNKKRDNLSKQEKEQIISFAYQHKDIIFQRSIFQKAVKLYFNFAYPPFQCSFSKKDAEEHIKPFQKRFRAFVNNLMKNNINNKTMDISDISTVICTGGGFEMLWAKEEVENIFPDSHIAKFKNPKAAIAEGATIIASSLLEVISEKKFIIQDTLRVSEDIGIYVLSGDKDKFIPIIEKNTFWWQNEKSVKLILNEKTEEELNIELYLRNLQGEISPLGKLKVNNYPKRIKGGSKIELKISFEDEKTIRAKVVDLGFGEFFPKTDLCEEFSLSLG